MLKAQKRIKALISLLYLLQKKGNQNCAYFNNDLSILLWDATCGVSITSELRHYRSQDPILRSQRECEKVHHAIPLGSCSLYETLITVHMLLKFPVSFPQSAIFFLNRVVIAVFEISFAIFIYKSKTLEGHMTKSKFKYMYK